MKTKTDTCPSSQRFHKRIDNIKIYIKNINYIWRNPTSLAYLCCLFSSSLYLYYLLSSKHIKQCTLWNFITLCTIVTTNVNLSHSLTCTLSSLLKASVLICISQYGEKEKNFWTLQVCMYFVTNLFVRPKVAKKKEKRRRRGSTDMEDIYPTQWPQIYICSYTPGKSHCHCY